MRHLPPTLHNRLVLDGAVNAVPRTPAELAVSSVEWERRGPFARLVRARGPHARDSPGL